MAQITTEDGSETIPLRAGIYTTPELAAALFSEARAVIARGYGVPLFVCLAPVQKLQDRWNNPTVAPFIVSRGLQFQTLLIQGHGQCHRSILSAVTQIPKGCITVVFVDPTAEQSVYIIQVSEKGILASVESMVGILPKQPLFVDWVVKPMSRKELPRMCTVCKKEGKDIKKLCSVCLAFRYCSESCQKADWAVHKSECKQLIDLCARDNQWLA
jgi:hypothetical protein